MKTILCYITTLALPLLIGCADDDPVAVPISQPEVPPSETPLGLPPFDSTFFEIAGKPSESITYFGLDTVNIAHRTLYRYNQAGQVVEEVMHFEYDNHYASKRYWYEGEKLLFEHFKGEMWYTQYIYDEQDRKQDRISVDRREGKPDSTRTASYFYFDDNQIDDNQIVVQTSLPTLEYDNLPEGSYFLDSLIYEDNRLVQEYRFTFNSVDPPFYLQAQRNYVYNAKGQLEKVWLMDGIRNVFDGSETFKPGVIESYTYEGGRLTGFRMYDAYKNFTLSNTVQYFYPDR